MENNAVINNNSKLLRTIALISGLVGSAFLLIMIFMNAFSATVFGTTKNMTMLSYWGDYLFIVFILIAISVAFTLLKLGALQTIHGSIIVVLSVSIFAELNSRGNGYVGVNIGAGTYFLLIASALVLVSGILYLVADHQDKRAGTSIERSTAIKRVNLIAKIIYIVLAVLIGGIVVLSLAFSKIGNKGYEETATKFMDAAVAGNIVEIKATTSDDLKDNNGFLEAFDNDIMSNSLMVGMGLGSTDSLSKDSKDELNAAMDDFAKRYVTSYEIKEVEVDSANEKATVTIKAQIQSMDIGSTMNKKAEKISAEYTKANYDKVSNYFSTMSETKAMAKVVDDLMPQLTEAMNEAFDDAGTKDTEITLTVTKVDGKCLVTEISYDD